MDEVLSQVMITSGCEALLNPYTLLVWTKHGHCAVGDDPRIYRPFGRRAARLVLAEGVGICIVEEYEHARRRVAHIYAELIGYGPTNDAHGAAPTFFSREALLGGVGDANAILAIRRGS